MEIKKSYWTSDGNNINLEVPFMKVDKERRVVSGFATLDNIDKHGDIVDTSASLNAFTRFRGNIREMHQPIAVGKVVSFKQQDFYDAKTKKNYSGVFVDVYVSKGAQDTWEKVLDGTLSGFSIGGSVNKSDVVLDKDGSEGPVRVIQDYDLTELSLVDNPANQFANVFSIQKADIGFKVTGMATVIKTLNVFYCENDKIASAEEVESRSCDVCSSDMKTIGWIEDSVTKSADLESIVNSYIAKDITGEGGNEMADELNAEVEETVEAEVAVEEVVEETTEAPAEEIEKSLEGDELAEETTETPTEDVVEEVVEEAADEVVEDDSEVEKMLSGIKTYISEAIAKASDTPGVEEIIAQMTSQISKMADSHTEMMKSVDTVKSTVDALQARMDSYESSTAVKKSNDLDNESMVAIKKSDSIWKGHFLGVQDL